MKKSFLLVIFILLVCLPTQAFCLDKDSAPGKSFYLHLHAGHFSGNDDAGKIKSEGSGNGYGLGGGFFLTQNLSIEGDFTYFTDDYRRDSSTLAPGTSSNKIEIASVSLALNTKYFFRHKKLTIFFGGGLGFYDSDIYVQEVDTTRMSNVEGDQAIGYQALAGMDYAFRDRFYFELGWRGIFLDQDFGSYSNGVVDAGGDYFYIGFRGDYGR